MKKSIWVFFVSSLFGSNSSIDERIYSLSKQIQALSEEVKDTKSSQDKKFSIPAQLITDLNIASIKNYFSLFKDICLVISNQISILITDLNRLTEVIDLSTKVLQIYIFLFIIMQFISWIIRMIFLQSPIGLIANIVNLFIQSLPELVCWLLHYVPKILSLAGLDKLPILDLNLKVPFQNQYSYLFSQASLIFLVNTSAFLFSQFINPNGAIWNTIKPLLFNILTIKLSKLSLNSFILITNYPNATNFVENMNQLEIALTFIIMVYFIFKLRDLVNFKNLHIKSIFRYISLPIISSAIFAYTSNSNEANFIYKLLSSLSVMPILNKVYTLWKAYSYNYIKNLPNQNRRSLIEVFVITNNALKIILFPLSVLIITAIFNITLVYEVHNFFAKTYIYRLFMIIFLFFALRIFLLLNTYFWGMYGQNHIFKRAFDKHRIETFALISKNVSSIFIIMVCAFIFLSLLGMDISPLFQSVGFISAALAYSLQEFIRDIVNGLLILYDNSIKVGELIEYEKRTAIVQEMHLRYLRIRFDDGLLITIPFHKFDLIKNRSKGYSYIILNISFARNVDLKLAEDAVKEAFNAIREKPELKYKIVGDIELRDLAEVTAFSYVMQCRICVQANSQYKIKRLLNKEMKIVLDKYNIDLAFPPVANATTAPSLSTGDAFPDFQ